MWIMRGTNRIEIIAFQQDKVIQKALLSQHFPMHWIMLVIIDTSHCEWPSIQFRVHLRAAKKGSRDGYLPKADDRFGLDWFFSFMAQDLYSGYKDVAAPGATIEL